MIIYVIMIIVSMFFAYLAVHSTKIYSFKLALKSGNTSFPDYRVNVNKQNFYMLMSFLPLFLVSALRYMVGVDYNSYAWIFEAITKLKEPTHVEFGYKLLNNIVGFFSDNFVWIFVITSFIILTFFLFGIKDNSDNFAYSLFLFITLGYFFYSMNSVRHFMALSIYFFAQKYMKKQEFAKFLLLILIAASFHKIALVGIPIYFIFSRKFKFSYYAVITALLLICAVLNKQIMNIIFTFIYTSYKNSVYNVYDFSIFNVLLSAIASFFAIAYYKPLIEKDKSNIIYINSALFMLMFYLTCWWIPTPTRIGHFGTILFILLFPKAIGCEKNKKVRIFYYVALTIFALLFFAVMMTGADNPNIALLPYHSVFSR